ncbi:hypothetical protein THARTR1_05411 [Trichoderma harzianum]|uniref:Uncharacterized protein n=1 Tax=Trichoderma harzianum TaxID=5544 RepID=A0A2K0U8V1_TRIHA|nr:hypothetical protein THARTR1_05411 [Trichoderma harzianum]
MHTAKLFVLAIAAATAAANSVATVLDTSTAQHISIGTESGFSSAEDATVPVVSASVTQASRTDADAETTEASSSDASASTIGVTRSLNFPNATSSSVVPTKSQNTTTPTSHVTGGAIPQQMQSSMAGLIGFCIMGLIML